MAPWISQVVPAYAVASFGEDWLTARVAQHPRRVRFVVPAPGQTRARLRGKHGNSAPVRQGAKVGGHPSSTQPVRQAVSR